MSYYVRLMRQEDVIQVTEIDREAFPTQWPPANYQHELRSRLAHYIVACDDERTINTPRVEASPEKVMAGRASRLWRLFRRRSFDKELPSSGGHYIIGFAGFWVMADETHITSIAVRESYRRQGVGELLIMIIADLAAELKASIITLEVRASNITAQNLYLKYGFTQVGIRRGYYTDNREDGILMTIQNIDSSSFQAHLQQLKQAHTRKCQIVSYQIVR